MFRVRSPTALKVQRQSGASPEKTFHRLAPPSVSSPSPEESRRSSSFAVSILLETISLPSGLSYQRNAGIPVLSPRRIPAWLAEVCDERSGSQGRSLCEPSAIQRCSV